MTAEESGKEIEGKEGKVIFFFFFFFFLG